jgi:uncharacterized membrane protein HdeD (DUF308 family)
VDFFIVRSAGALAIRGSIAIVLGLIALLVPGLTFLALTIAFGAYAFIDGVWALIAIFDQRTRLHRGWLVLEAIAGIFVGVFTAIWPRVAALNLTFLIAAWAIVTGVFKIINAIRLRKQIRHEALLILSGIASVIFGGILVWMPITGIIGMMWAVGIFGIAFGSMLLALSIRMHSWAEIPPTEAGATPRAA